MLYCRRLKEAKQQMPFHSHPRPRRQSVKRAERDKADILLSQAHASTPSEFWFTQSAESQHLKDTSTWLALHLLAFKFTQTTPRSVGTCLHSFPRQDLWGTDHGFEPQCYKTKLEHPAESSLLLTLSVLVFHISDSPRSSEFTIPSHVAAVTVSTS